MEWIGKGLFGLAVVTTILGGLLTIIVLRSVKNPIMDVMPSMGGMRQG